jgi:hypothetical protein
MNASFIAKSAVVLALGALAGCPLPPEPQGGVSFTYVLLVNDGAGNAIAAINCQDAGVATIKFNLGNDTDNSGVLDAAENITQLQASCNQADANNDGDLLADEFGTFDSGFEIAAGTFDAISVELLDANNQNIPWQTFDSVNNADVFSFLGDTTIVDQQTLVVTFLGDPATQVDGELQAFVGF